MAVIWTVSLLLALSFSLPTVMSLSNSCFSTNCTATNNAKGYQITVDQRSRLKSTELKDYFKWFQEPSMGSMKSIFNLRRIRESSRTSLSKITDVGLLCSSSGFHYFKSIGECFMIEFYDKVNTIFCMDLPSSMMRVAAKIPRFCKPFDSEKFTDGTTVGSGTPSNWLGHESFLGMLIYPGEDRMNSCSIMETQGFEHVRARLDFYNEDLSTPAASLFIVAALVLILLMLRALIRRKKLFSETYWSRTSKTKLNKPGCNQITIWTKKQESIACCFGEINKTTIESTECPRFGSFIEYVEIPVSGQGSPSKELKANPVRRSMRIRNKSLQPAPTFTISLR